MMRRIIKKLRYIWCHFAHADAIALIDPDGSWVCVKCGLKIDPWR